MHGWHGCYYRIDLTEARIEPVKLAEAELQAHIGGVGLAALLMLEVCPSGVGALEPETALVIAFSPLVGTPLTTSAKFAVVGKSPLTERFCDSLCSSHFALAGKRAGADAFVLTGAADRWAVLVIDEDAIRLEYADTLAGLPARDAEKLVRQRLGPEFQTLSIGPAAENRVLYAGISHDGRHAGRGGLGAVLASKNIKAIAVRGSRRTTVADPGRVVRLSRDLSARSFGPATEKYRELGTVGNLLSLNRLGVLPSNGFRDSTFARVEELSGESLAMLPERLRKSCASCTIGCEHVFPLKDGESVRIEYETLFALGSLCGIGDRDAVLKAAAACDCVGIDTVSFGATFAFASECAERGWIEAPGEFDLRIGSAAGLLEAIEWTARRRGFGNALADGSRNLALRIGGPAIALAPHVKGLELPGYDPAKLPMAALGFAVNPRGADHNRSAGYEVDLSGRSDRNRPAFEDVAALIEAEDRAALLDSAILCKFIRGVFDDFWGETAELLNAVTGVCYSSDSLRESVRRIAFAKRRFNELAGWDLSEDMVPPRFLKGSGEFGRSDAVLDRSTFEALRSRYYSLRGLDSQGRILQTIPREY